jgi:histone-lysine N-methyltransferase SETD1
VITTKDSEGDSSDPGDDVSLSSKGLKADIPMEVDDDDSSSTPEKLQNDDPQSKRLRSARIAAGTATVTKDGPLKEELRQELQTRCKEEAESLHKKCLERACCGILLALMRRDPLLLFASPVTAEGYSAVIRNPIDFGMIREQVLEGKYTSLGSFIADCRLLCTNALAYNPPGSLYWKCAKELHDVLAVMQKRTQKWMTAIKDTHATAWRRTRNEKESVGANDDDVTDVEVQDPLAELRKTWPEAIDLLDDAEWLRRQVEADFMRTRENEIAYYAALAVRRTAAGAETAMAPYPDSGGPYNVVTRRSHVDDEALRRAIDERVSGITHPVELKDLPGWREDSIMRILRRAQTRRLDGMSSTNVGCARCDGTPDEVKNQSKSSQLSRLTKYKPKRNEQIRIDPSRENLSAGMSSQTTRARLQSVLAELVNEKDWNTKAQVANQVAVTVRGSGIHGWGLYADQYFKKGDVVAEYIGEYVSLAVTEAREKLYREHRIQDYQFRVDDSLVIDATLRGGHGRYINHNCNPNCVAKIIAGAPPNEHLKRVLIIAKRKIEPREELSYDYQFPLEFDLNARIPCNCMSDQCRGFMNWDLPEKGSATQSFRTQKRGANMRDRIRRLGRPLKGEKGGDADDDDDSS